MSRTVANYIDYLYRELDAKVIEKLMSVPPGTIVLRSSVNGDLFKHPHVVLWHRFLLEHFTPEPKPFALILPCTSIKPYRLSPTHRIADSRLARLGLKDVVSIYVISEPMVLVPRELDIYYPFANYEYPPKHLNLESRRMFVDILSKVLRKLRIHRAIVAVLPQHHRSILLEALTRVGKEIAIEVIPYGRKAFNTISKAVDMLYRLAIDMKTIDKDANRG